MSGMGGSMFGMDIFGLLGVIALVLVIAAAIKVLFFDRHR